MKLRSLSILSVLLLSASICLSQGNGNTLQGKVTYITSNSVYVRFADTGNINVGDTLKVPRGSTATACLIVKNKSSSSCVATPVKGCDLKVGDLITYRPAVAEKGTGAAPARVVTQPAKDDSKRSIEKIRGSVSASSYSNLSANHGNTTKAMYRLSFYAPHINRSKFSFETYMNYRQTFTPGDSARPKDVFNIYSLSMQFDASPTLSLVLGRRINPKVSSIGAIDGLQVEKSFGSFYLGLLGGFRPDVIDYSFNPDLLQYGGYIGLKSDTKGLYSTTTIGLMEQGNKGNTDRRYAYFQHSSSISQNLNVFAAFELDLYNQVTADSVGDPRLTNLFVSATYRISRKVDFGLSYSSRKKILYYETLKTEIERLLDDDVARQGLRANANFRPINTVSLGVSYSKRFQANDLNKSDNINGYASWSKIPSIGGRLFVNYNRNTSNYMETSIWSFRHSRSLIKTKLDGDIYYRMVDYNYIASETITKQKYYGASLSYQVAKKLTLNVLGELAATAEEENYRIYARITKNL